MARATDKENLRRRREAQALFESPDNAFDMAITNNATQTSAMDLLVAGSSSNKNRFRSRPRRTVTTSVVDYFANRLRHAERITTASREVTIEDHHRQQTETPARNPYMHSINPVQMWWSLIKHQLCFARTQFPRSLRGVIQFTATPTFDAFHLVLEGPNSEGFEGFALRADTKVEITAAEMKHVLLALRDGSSTFHVQGDVNLYRRFFLHLAAASPVE